MTTKTFMNQKPYRTSDEDDDLSLADIRSLKISSPTAEEKVTFFVFLLETVLKNRMIDVE